MKSFRQTVDEFMGMSLNYHPAKLPEGKVPLAANCSFFRRGSWRPRKGMVHANVARLSVAINLLRGFTLKSGDYALMYGANATLRGKTNVAAHTAGDLGGDTLTPPATRSADGFPSTAVLGHRCYVADGLVALAYWDGLSTTMEAAGITAPTQADAGDWTPSPTAAAGNCSVGFHAFRYRYMDTRTGYVSDPSAEYVVEVDGGDGQLTFAINTSGAGNIIRSTQGKVDTIVVEMTLVDGREFYEAARVGNAESSVVVSIGDAALERAPLIYPEDGHGAAPLRKVIVAHRGRLWTFGSAAPIVGDNTVTVVNGDATVTGSSLYTAGVAVGLFIRFAGDSRSYEIASLDMGSNSIELTEVYAGTGGNKLFELFAAEGDNLVYVSRAGYPESFDPDDGFVVPPTDSSSAPLTAGVGFGQAMLFFSANSMWRLDWTLEPGVDGARRLIANRGCVSHRCTVTVETVVGLRCFTLDTQGVHVFDGVNAVEVATDLRALFDGTDPTYPLDWSADLDTWFAVNLPRERAIRWYVTYGSGGGLPNLYLQLDYDLMAWSVGPQDVTKAGGAAVLSADGLRPMLGDGLGHVWIADEGTVEGGHASYTVLTGAAGSTASVVNVDETLPTTGYGLAGAPITWLKGDGTSETRVILSNTTSAITLHTTSQTPSSGNTGFSSAPQDGDRLEVGRIPAELLTREWVASQVGKREVCEWRTLYLEYEPTSADRVIFLLIYKDGALVTDYGPHLVAGAEAGVERPGTNPNYHPDYWVVHTNQARGSVRLPLGLESAARVQLKILSYEPATALEIHRIQLTGRSGEPQE